MSQDKQQQVSPTTTMLKSKQQQQITTAPQTTSEAVKRQAAASKEAADMNKTQTKLVANLHSAANDGKVELVRLLLRCGADVNAQDEQFGNTALHQSAWNGFSETVQVLCKYRANTSTRNKAQFTPLHLACQQGHNQTARLLLMANAKTEAKNSYGDTPLHTAARYGHAGVARILLSAKCNLNQVNKNNDTPLHIAAAMGRRKITKILMQSGAEPAIKNKQGETAMDIALRKDLIDIQELIANPPPATPKLSAHLQTTAAAADDNVGEKSARCLSQLERRYGQLYGVTSATASASAVATNLLNGGHLRLQRQRERGHHHSQHRHAQATAAAGAPMQRYSSQESSLLGQTRLTSRPLNRQQQQQYKLTLAGRHRRSTSTRAVQLAGGEFELPVDVPDDAAGGDNQRSANDIRQSSRKGLSLSVATLPGQQQLESLRSKSQQDQRLVKAKLQHQHQRHRTRTLVGGSGADLHLLAGPIARRQHTRSCEPSNNAEGDSELRAVLGEACAPDARDNPNEWAAIMAESALYKGADSPAVILQGQAAANGDHKGATCDEAATAALLRATKRGAAKRGSQTSKGCGSPSSAASLRSSASKSRGRLVVESGRARRSANSIISNSNGRQRRPTLPVRRPNLGTCVGKLRLLRLRNMVSKRSNEERQQKETNEEDENSSAEKTHIARTGDTQRGKGVDTTKKETKREAESKDDECATIETVERAQDESAKKQQQQKAFGRRHERLLRGAEQGPVALAPNGCQLLAARPLAALNDDTQLYAIPKKSKAKQEQQRQPQQVANNGDNKDACERTNGSLATSNSGSSDQHQQVKASKESDEVTIRIPSGGPALTSDGGHSSSCSSAGSFAQMSPLSSSSRIASSSDECIDLVCVAQHNQKQSSNQQQQKVKLVSQVRRVSHISTNVNGMGAAATVATSTADKRPAVIGVHADRDLCAPGYSVIRERPLSVQPSERSEPCLCQPYGNNNSAQRQRAASVVPEAMMADCKAACAGLGLDTNSKQRPPANKSSVGRPEGISLPAQSEGQPGQRQQKGANSSKLSATSGESRTNKLLQLLHLDSRSKERAQGKQPATNSDNLDTDAKQQQIKVNNGTAAAAALAATISMPIVGSNDSAPGNKLDRPPMSAIAGGYYAYSPVVQSSSELKLPIATASGNSVSAKGITTINVNRANENQEQLSANNKPLAVVAKTKSNGNGNAKKSWLISKFSLSSNSIQHATATTSASASASGANSRTTRATSRTGQSSTTVHVSPVRTELTTLTASNSNGIPIERTLPTNSSPAGNALALVPLESAASSANNSCLLGPERKAESVTINGQELHKMAAAGRTAAAAASFHWAAAASSSESPVTARDELSLHHQQLRLHQQQQQQQLIRPKSALSATSASLIAAQKSLAAAAAAKVRRDRMVKMVAGGDAADNEDEEDDDDDAGSMGAIVEPDFAASKESVLTVKTCKPPFWHSNGHHHHQPLVVATSNGGSGVVVGGPKYLITTGGQHHRSGTNSVGMSDSSPSNNGAESDNSLQTTTGSMNTDNTSAGGGTGTSNGVEQNPSPLGILSRILLNNKGLGSRKIQQQQQQHKQLGDVATSVADSSGSTLRDEHSHQRNEFLSPNLSTPNSSDQSPQTTVSQKLDQLGSRSRCPIVLTKSNELPTTKGHHSADHATIEEATGGKSNKDLQRVGSPAVSANVAPRPPSKSAMKPASSRLANGHLHEQNSVSQILIEPMNGLPRVSSYTQIFSAMASTNNQGAYKQQQTLRPMDDSRPALCNYHSMNNKRNNPAHHSTHYGLYSPYGLYQNARYSFHQESYNQQEAVKYTNHQYQQQRPMRHLSHHDLSRANHFQQHLTDQVDLTLPATAVNYEYYLEAGTPAAPTATAPAYHPHLSQPARYHYATNANDNLTYPAPNYTHDYSIYIPYYINASQTPREPPTQSTTTHSTCQNGNSATS